MARSNSPDKIYCKDPENPDGPWLEFNVPQFSVNPKPPITYPSEWFESHPNCKPKTLHHKTKFSDTELYNHVYEHWGKGSLSVHIACDFAIRTLRGIKEKTDDTWQSFGLTIATPGSTISPMDLLVIEETELESPSLSSNLQSAPPEENMGMLSLIMSVYGLNEPNSTPRRQVEYPNSRKDLYSLFAKYPFYTSKRLADAPNLYKLWYKNCTYRAIIAATDMFFCKFNESKFSSLRVATQLSRWNGCSAMGYMDLLSEILSLPKSECYQFIFLVKVKDEMKKMEREGQEIDKADSYSPYLLNLKLCERSPYSASQNHLLHNYVHFIGSMFGVRRSRNARFLDDGHNSFDTFSVLAIAAVHIAYFRQKPEYPQNIPKEKFDELLDTIRDAIENHKIRKEIAKWFTETTSKWGHISDGSCARQIVEEFESARSMSQIFAKR